MIFISCDKNRKEFRWKFAIKSRGNCISVIFRLWSLIKTELWISPQFNLIASNWDVQLKFNYERISEGRPSSDILWHQSEMIKLFILSNALSFSQFFWWKLWIAWFRGKFPSNIFFRTFYHSCWKIMYFIVKWKPIGE